MEIQIISIYAGKIWNGWFEPVPDVGLFDRYPGVQLSEAALVLFCGIGHAAHLLYPNDVQKHHGTAERKSKISKPDLEMAGEIFQGKNSNGTGKILRILQMQELRTNRSCAERER